MWNVDELFVLSDLHLAAERNAGFFRADVELADCLRWILKETRKTLTVLAGDVLDFLVPYSGRPTDGFEKLGELTHQIIDHHPEVFEAMAALACSPQHRLVILGGNHDPELIFPMVQEVVERRLGLDYMSSTVRWLVQGEALNLRVGNVAVVVEHGNRLDPWNRINYSALQGTLSLSSRNLSTNGDYQPPSGTRLALEVVNELRDNHPWVDYLKPETGMVLPVLWHFAKGDQRMGLSRLADDYLNTKSVAHIQKTGNVHRMERLYKGASEAEYSPADRNFKDWVDFINDKQRLNLDTEEVERMLIEKLRTVSAQDSFFDTDQPDDSIADLGPVFEGGADLVIHGHTHSAKACAVEGGFYINTGTWGQLLRLPKSNESNEVWQDFLSRLRTNDVQGFRRPTFARVRRLQGQDVSTASLLEWQQSGPKILTTSRFSDRRTGWRMKE